MRSDMLGGGGFSNMATTQTETESFRDFLNQGIDNGLKNLSPEEAVKEFRAYQNQLERFVAETQTSIDDGTAPTELDVDALKERAIKRIAEQSENTDG